MGYPGIRVQPSGDLLRLSPRCPEAVTGLKIRGLQYLGNELGVEYSCDRDNKARVPSAVSISVTRADIHAQELIVSSHGRSSTKSTNRSINQVQVDLNEESVALTHGRAGVFVELTALGGEVFIKAATQQKA